MAISSIAFVPSRFSVSFATDSGAEISCPFVPCLGDYLIANPGATTEGVDPDELPFEYWHFRADLSDLSKLPILDQGALSWYLTAHEAVLAFESRVRKLFGSEEAFREYVVSNLLGDGPSFDDVYYKHFVWH